VTNTRGANSQAPFVGWDEPYIYSLLIISFLHFGLFLIWEGRIARSPILPFAIWKAPSFGPLMLTLVFAFMSIGIEFWYTQVWMKVFRGFNHIQSGLGFLPLTILGVGASFLAGWLTTRLPAQIILAIGCIAAGVSNTLLATMPEHQTYWAMLFPAMICVAFTADLLFAAAQIIASNSVPSRYQGAAGSLVGALTQYGMSTGIGFAGTVQTYVSKSTNSTVKGVRGANYLGIGLAVLALVLNVLFVRMPKASKGK
jgi:MFS family permease